jgi:hypothetical protein
MELMERSPLIGDVDDWQVGDPTELIQETGGRWSLAFSFTDKKRVLAVALFVTGPKMELVLGAVGGHTINQGIGGHALFGFREVKGNQTGNTVMGGDDEHWFTIGEEGRSSLADAAGGGFPTAHTSQGIPFHRQRLPGEAPNGIGFVEQEDENEAENQAGSEGGFDERGALVESMGPVDDRQAEERDDGWGDPVRLDAGTQGEEEADEKQRRAHAEQEE